MYLAAVAFKNISLLERSCNVTSVLHYIFFHIGGSLVYVKVVIWREICSIMGWACQPFLCFTMIHFPEIFPGPARVSRSNVIVTRYGTESNSPDKFDRRLLHCVEIHEAVWEAKHEDARSCNATMLIVYPVDGL